MKRNKKTNKAIKYYMISTDSFRFISTSLSNLTDNLPGKVHEKRCDNSKCLV